VCGKNVTQQRRFAAAERAGDQCDGRAKHVENDEGRMTNDELMTKHESLFLRNAMASGTDALQFSSFGFRHF